jgi:hypothetical protein
MTVLCVLARVIRFVHLPLWAELILCVTESSQYGLKYMERGVSTGAQTAEGHLRATEQYASAVQVSASPMGRGLNLVRSSCRECAFPHVVELRVPSRAW